MDVWGEDDRVDLSRLRAWAARLRQPLGDDLAKPCYGSAPSGTWTMHCGVDVDITGEGSDAGGNAGESAAAARVATSPGAAFPSPGRLHIGGLWQLSLPQPRPAG